MKINIAEYCDGNHNEPFTLTDDTNTVKGHLDTEKNWYIISFDNFILAVKDVGDDNMWYVNLDNYDSELITGVQRELYHIPFNRWMRKEGYPKGHDTYLKVFLHEDEMQKALDDLYEDEFVLNK